jgi:hypothetical protein
VTPVVNPHRMTTLAKDGFRMPALHSATHISPKPSSFHQGLPDPHWRRAMEDEYSALMSNHTWDLVPRPPVSTSLLASGTSNTSSTQMDLLGDTRLAGYVVDSPSDQALTMMRHLAMLSNQLQFVLFCLSPSPGAGPFISWM